MYVVMAVNVRFKTVPVKVMNIELKILFMINGFESIILKLNKVIPFGKILNPVNSLILSGDVNAIARIFNKGTSTANEIINNPILITVLARPSLFNFTILTTHPFQLFVWK